MTGGRVLQCNIAKLVRSGGNLVRFVVRRRDPWVEARNPYHLSGGNSERTDCTDYEMGPCSRSDGTE